MDLIGYVYKSLRILLKPEGEIKVKQKFDNMELIVKTQNFIKNRTHGHNIKPFKESCKKKKNPYNSFIKLIES